MGCSCTARTLQNPRPQSKASYPTNKPFQEEANKERQTIKQKDSNQAAYSQAKSSNEIQMNHIPSPKSLSPIKFQSRPSNYDSKTGELNIIRKETSSDEEEEQKYGIFSDKNKTGNITYSKFSPRKRRQDSSSFKSKKIIMKTLSDISLFRPDQSEEFDIDDLDLNETANVAESTFQKEGSTIAFNNQNHR